MSRYVKAPMTKRAKAWIEDEVSWDDAPMIPNIEVDNHECVETGLLWADGSTIWRAPNPIGFGSDLDG